MSVHCKSFVVQSLGWHPNHRLVVLNIATKIARKKLYPPSHGLSRNVRDAIFPMCVSMLGCGKYLVTFPNVLEEPSPLLAKIGRTRKQLIGSSPTDESAKRKSCAGTFKLRESDSTPSRPRFSFCTIPASLFTNGRITARLELLADPHTPKAKSGRNAIRFGGF